MELPGDEELAALDKEDISQHNWLSRNTVRYDDNKSTVSDEGNKDEDEEVVNKTSMSYLEKQKQILDA